MQAVAHAISLVPVFALKGFVGSHTHSHDTVLKANGTAANAINYLKEFVSLFSSILNQSREIKCLFSPAKGLYIINDVTKACSLIFFFSEML